VHQPREGPVLRRCHPELPLPLQDDEAVYGGSQRPHRVDRLVRAEPQLPPRGEGLLDKRPGHRGVVWIVRRERDLGHGGEEARVDMA
jgi:hypothetical protein